MYDDFEGMDKLKVAPEDKAYIRSVFKWGADGREHGIALIDKIAYKFTSNLENKVLIPDKIVELLDSDGLKDVKLYHNHPNGTAPSAADLEQFLHNRVSAIYTIGSNGHIHLVVFDGGILPKVSEYEAFIDTLADELNTMLYDEVASGALSINDANYIFAKEQAYRIARQYDWKYYGGRINEIL
jgi:hypothetical protein